MYSSKNQIKYILYKFTPAILLFTSILNEIDFNNLGLKYFSFNFSYILIFYYNLKRENGIGLISVFIAGLFNDVLSGIPMGISSLNFLLLCAAASYLRNITLRPSVIKDWVFFLITILFLNFFSYTYLIMIFGYEINYFDQVINIFFTFLLYLLFSTLFKFYDIFIIGQSN